MTARILDGKRIADELLDSVAARVQARVAQGKRVPGLAVVLVGEDPASSVYVRNKRRACARVGFRSLDFDLPATTTRGGAARADRPAQRRSKASRHPRAVAAAAGINGTAIIDRIDPRKDVDGFQAVNVGRLALRQRGLRPCTPKGVMTLLAHTDRPVRGQKAVVVGVSNHVGRPLMLELLLAGCTTTAATSSRAIWKAKCARPTSSSSRSGGPSSIKGDWIKPGAVVIDVGINRLEDGRLVGDVEFAPAAERASWITPVPGGVGPMTVATLIENTLEADRERSSTEPRRAAIPRRPSRCIDYHSRHCPIRPCSPTRCSA